MRKSLFGLLTVLILMFIAGCSSSTGSSDGGTTEDKEEKSETITLGVTPWTSTVPPTKIASVILQEMGYEVKEMSADAGSVYAGLSRGDIDVFMDSWLPAHDPYLEKYADKIEDTAVSYDKANAGFVVPNYMEEINTVADLAGKEKEFNNEMFSIEHGTVAAEKIDEVIKAHELDIKQVNASEGAMIAEAMRKMEKEEPVLFYGWRPHTMFNKLDVKIIEDEKGIFSENGSSVHVITNKELKERAPEAYAFLSNWSISIDDIEAMIAKIENDKQDPEEVAREWIENNQDKVKEMLGE